MASEPMKLDDGGFAFPFQCNLETCDHIGCKGMSKRELYACEAMKALIIVAGTTEEGAGAFKDTCHESGMGARELLARAAAEHADALLAELKRTETAEAAPERRGLKTEHGETR